MNVDGVALIVVSRVEGSEKAGDLPTRVMGP